MIDVEIQIERLVDLHIGIARLNEMLALRNQQVDELKIQLKLATEGSRTAQ